MNPGSALRDPPAPVSDYGPEMRAELEAQADALEAFKAAVDAFAETWRDLRNAYKANNLARAEEFARILSVESADWAYDLDEARDALMAIDEVWG